MTTANPPIDEGTGETSGGNLPSAVADNAVSLEKFSLGDEFVEKNFKDGKLYGRFDSMEAVLNTLHSVETKYANLVRETKQPQDGGAPQPAQEVNVYDAAKPAIDKFMAQNFSFDGLDQELSELSQKTGKSIAEIKLAALELKEQVVNAHSLVGGSDEYNNMLTWAKTSLNYAQRADFDKSLRAGMGEYAIKGLYAEYKNSTQSTNPRQPTRIDGDRGANVGAIRAYTTRQELLKDREYIQSKAGKGDKAARDLHSKRLAVTPDTVIYGR